LLSKNYQINAFELCFFGGLYRNLHLQIMPYKVDKVYSRNFEN